VTSIDIYTDGSCSPLKNIGVWAVLFIYNGKRTSIYNIAHDTNHNRLELMAVIEALKKIDFEFNGMTIVNLYTDSQYVNDLPGRLKYLEAKNYITNKGKTINNYDLITEFKKWFEHLNVNIIKVKAHQKVKEEENPNREVDKLARRVLREYIQNNLF